MLARFDGDPRQGIIDTVFCGVYVGVVQTNGHGAIDLLIQASNTVHSYHDQLPSSIKGANLYCHI